MPTTRRATTCDVLLVCTANYCRSPYVAAVLRDALPGLRIESAGVRPVPAEFPNPALGPLLAARAISAPVDLPSKLTSARVRGARLVVTAEHAHRVIAVRRQRSAAQRVVTLKELARLVAAALVPPLGLAETLDVVAAALARPDDREHDDDLADPIGLDAAAYRAMADEVDAALAVVVPALAGKR